MKMFPSDVLKQIHTFAAFLHSFEDIVVKLCELLGKGLFDNPVTFITAFFDNPQSLKVSATSQIVIQTVNIGVGATVRLQTRHNGKRAFLCF